LRAIWSSADTYTYSNCVTYSDIHCYTDWYSDSNINPEFDAASYSDAEISSKSAITPDSPHRTSHRCRLHLRRVLLQCLDLSPLLT
jgi:hypothetical protein